MEGISSILIAFITGVMGPVILLLLRNKIEKRNKPDMVQETLFVSELVHNKIEEIREGVKADRVWISQFHNGGHFYPTGKSIAKFSIMYETVEVGVSSIQQNLQNIPVNLFSRSMNRLVNSDTIEIPDYNSEEILTYGLKYMAEDNGLKSGYLFAIKTIDDKFIGILGIDYTKKRVSLDDDVINNILVQSSTLGGVIMNHLKE